jgi:hypothetical protein
VPEIAQLALFGLAVFLATLTPLLWLTRPGPAEDEDGTPATPDEPSRYDHPLTLERTWRPARSDAVR